MSTLHENIPGRRLISATLLGTLLLGGCSLPEYGPETTGNVAVLPGEDTPEDQTKQLNQWLTDNPSKRIVDVAALSSGGKFSSVQALQIVTEDGQNKEQHCDYLKPAEDYDIYSAEADASLQSWVDDNPDRQIVALVGLTVQEGYIICSEPTDASE